MYSGFIRVRAQATNRCGAGDSYTFYLAKSGSNGYRIAPNPTKETVTVLFDQKEIIDDIVSTVSVLNDKGEVVRMHDANENRKKHQLAMTNQISFDVRSLPRGIYFLHVAYEKDVIFKSQIILD